MTILGSKADIALEQQARKKASPINGAGLYYLVAGA
jgi:hypothetical protein